MNNSSFPVPSRNMYWRDIQKTESNPEIEERRNVYIYYRGGLPDSVVYWQGEERSEAEEWLHSVAFARCSAKMCGIRVTKFGDRCATHKR